MGLGIMPPTGQGMEERLTTPIHQFGAALRHANSLALPACYKGRGAMAFDVPEKNPQAQRDSCRQSPRKWKDLRGVAQSLPVSATQELHERARVEELQRVHT